jgi:hypothetical protein
MRRMLSPLVALGLLTLALTAPLAASAAPVRAAAAASACDPSKAYPPSPNATVQINTTNPFVGETVKVSGINYCPNEAVDITIAGQHVGTGHTDANGSFDPNVVVPGPAGDKQVCGIGASGLSNDQDCLTINVRATGATHQPGGGGTAMTGVEIALLGLLALVLVVAGVVMTTLGRHRRAARV